MFKRLLPVLLAFIFFSCSRPTAENNSTTDSTVVGGEDPANDTTYNGNTDGDYFFSEADSLRELENAKAQEASQDEGEEENKEMIDINQPVIDVCGFSNDGKYFAFTQMLVGESADGTASVFVIDVAKNEWAAKPTVVENLNDVLEDTLAKVRNVVLPKYGIAYQKNPGVEYNLETDNKVTIEGKQYTVDLKIENLLIDLHVRGNGKDITLQKDKKLPASRGSVREYRLRTAYVSGDRIAVFVEYDGEIGVGFENYRYFDRKNIAVTGVVK
jgi:predicted secreted protein